MSPWDRCVFQLMKKVTFRRILTFSQLAKMGPFDLNRDGIVDAADMCIMVDNWHAENTLCDIAPAPLRDGFVDAQDLTVLAEHLFEEVPQLNRLDTGSREPPPKEKKNAQYCNNE